jgi:hypothetical protein
VTTLIRQALSRPGPTGRPPGSSPRPGNPLSKPGPTGRIPGSSPRPGSPLSKPGPTGRTPGSSPGSSPGRSPRPGSRRRAMPNRRRRRAMLRPRRRRSLSPAMRRRRTTAAALAPIGQSPPQRVSTAAHMILTRMSGRDYAAVTAPQRPQRCAATHTKPCWQHPAYPSRDAVSARGLLFEFGTAPAHALTCIELRGVPACRRSMWRHLAATRVARRLRS